MNIRMVNLHLIYPLIVSFIKLLLFKVLSKMSHWTKKWSLLQVARSIMWTVHGPKFLWGDVVLIAECYKSSALSYCYKYSNIKKQINIIKTYSSTQPSFVPFIFNIVNRSLLILQKVSCMHLVYLALKLVRHKFNEDIDK